MDDVDLMATCAILKTSNAFGVDPSTGFDPRMVTTKLRCGVPLNTLEIFVGIVLPITVLALFVWCCCCCCRGCRKESIVYVKSPSTRQLV